MKKLKLLYAEDECSTRKDQVIYLQSRYDFIIYEANDGLEALELYKKHTPDIVITDITMPRMTGLQLAREIRKISKHTKIIIATAHSEQEKLMEAFDSNVINYLIKPIDRKRLKDSIETAIATLSQAQEENNHFIFLNDSTKFDTLKCEYFVHNRYIKLPKSENRLLSFLCEHMNKKLSSYDIFIYIWDDIDKEYNADAVRTLVKKLRKKLPDGVLENIYGGHYRLVLA
ncbi:response regulator [Sulfurimonas sp. SAG-AH-194-L11]|nr:response regulator [Sulfurimonas sp. SAG-AH-194-L11]MDF1877711.1 response regulator [Sulfurimonas sp. SAG-AH-194-L11]